METIQFLIILFLIFIIIGVVLYYSFTPNLEIGINTQIPRIIHQVYIGHEELPEAVKENISQIKKLNPGWEHRLYKEEQIVKFISDNYDPVILELYNRINPDYVAARVDFFRYLLIYKVGGVYLDINSGINKSFNEIIKPGDEYILSYWNSRDWKDSYNYPYGEFQQWYLIAIPEHKFLEETIENVIKNITSYKIINPGVGKIGVLRTTGPFPYTLSILPILKNYKHTLYKNGIEGLIYKKIKKEIFPKKHYSELTSPIII